MEDERIRMWAPNQRGGVSILKSEYTLIVEFILSMLSRHGEIQLLDLIDKAQNELGSFFSKDVTWYLIQVKQDLAERGILKVTMQRNRTQVIRRRKTRLLKTK